jgi:glyoxylase-like metal-dependent hydrolase (beta-lactamase superfamily II)
MTYRGTNTYLLGTGDIIVIDPGPQDNAHLDAILGAIQPGQRITHIVVTHTHLDHSPLARPLSQACGAPVWAFGNASAGRSRVMQRLAQNGMIAGGEGVDHDFSPDHTLADGDRIGTSDLSLQVLHTPGHIGNHICLVWGDACFTADHVMGWASSLVSPPDGDLTDFMTSCTRLAAHEWRIFYPGHGAPITDPAQRLNWLIQHRQSREQEILTALLDGPANASELARRIYTDTPPPLLTAAARNVLAHLIDLHSKSKAYPITPLSEDARFARD